MIAVLLGLVAAACFGTMTVAVRMGLQRVPDALAASFVTAAVGFVVAALADLVISRGPDDLASGEVWPFLIAGLMAPGTAGLLFILGIELAGAARTAVLITAAPLLAAVPAFVLLGEPFHPALAVGAVLIVGGAVVLSRERLEETGFRRAGLVAAIAAAALIAARDNFARWAARHYDISGLAAGTAALLAAAALLLVFLVVTRGRRVVADVRRAFLPFIAGGVLLGLAYAALLEALTRGRVTVVTPLYATEALWTVLLSYVLIGRSERIGLRVVAAAALMVAGAALIGLFR